VRRMVWAAAAILAWFPWCEVEAQCLLPRPFELDRVNRQLGGHIVDYTKDHGADHSLWSPALGQWRDMYVYLPPGYDPSKSYPLILWLHGYSQDEQSFLTVGAPQLDQAMRTGQIPPSIVAVPDGSLRGVEGYFSAGSFFLNTPVGGRFEDYLMQDVWDFLTTNYPIRPEPEAHAIVGVSMGGGAAFHTAIKYQDRFKTAVGFYPPLNSRWEDCHGRYRGKFDPNCWGWRTNFDRGREVLGRFYFVFAVRERRVGFPLYGRGNPDTLALVSSENPIEMLDSYDVREGQLNLYVAYGGLDQFNIDAQVESFLYHAHERGVTVDVDFDPRGKHDNATVLRLMPAALVWLGRRLAPYAAE
jgi:S-formylglutathione hydrolase FrmB